MKRIILLVIALLVITATSKADGFINPQSDMFYGRTYTIQYSDEVPTESLQYYFAYSVDNGLNWIKFSDVKVWTCPDTAEAKLTVTTIGSVLIGLFTNPDGVWITTPYTYNATFQYSNNFEFIQQPDTIYNGGKYNFTIKVNPNEAPPEMVLRYTTNGGDSWMTWEAITFISGQSFKDITISNGNIKTATVWQLCYEMPTVVVCESDYIAYKERSTFFNFKTKGGQKEISDKATLMWEASYNFNKIEITTYFDNELLDISEYETDGIEINFAKNGEYTIVGVAKDANFIITKSLTFTVGDPCSFVKAQAVILRDSIETLNVALTKARKTIVWADEEILRLTTATDSLSKLTASQGLLIDSLKTRILELEDYIIVLKTDSLKLQLIYTEGCITVIKDETLFNTCETVYAKLMDNEHIYIVIPLEKRDLELTWWCYDIKGAWMGSGINRAGIIDIMIKQSSSHGVYIFYTLQEGIYKAYKFVI
jgi:hypothetical protein